MNKRTTSMTWTKIDSDFSNCICLVVISTGTAISQTVSIFPKRTSSSSSIKLHREVLKSISIWYSAPTSSLSNLQLSSGGTCNILVNRILSPVTMTRSILNLSLIFSKFLISSAFLTKKLNSGCGTSRSRRTSRLSPRATTLIPVSVMMPILPIPILLARAFPVMSSPA